MKLMVHGSRSIQSYDVVRDAIAASGFPTAGVTAILTTQDPGPPIFGYRWALSQTPKIPVQVYRANWNAHGKPAGIISLREMATYADAAVLLWDGSKEDWQTPMLRRYCKGLHPVCHVHFVTHIHSAAPATLEQQGRFESNLCNT